MEPGEARLFFVPLEDRTAADGSSLLLLTVLERKAWETETDFLARVTLVSALKSGGFSAASERVSVGISASESCESSSICISTT